MRNLIVNTEYFRESARHFEKYGSYTLAPEQSLEYDAFWDEEDKRCKEGYSVSGFKITGRHYAYLNYGVIEKVPESALVKNNRVSAMVDKVLGFPAFWEIDLGWWDAKQTAFDRPFGEGNHLVCAKTRGCGWSYKEAFDGVYNYNFIPKSKSFYLASTEDYLIKDGILNKVEVMLNFLNKHTDWYKNRHRHRTLMHQMASYESRENGKKIDKGYLSEIIGKTIDNANKARGMRGKKITFEEFGSFKNGKAGWGICRESVEQGGFIAGQMSAFGTGGEEGDSIEALDDMVNNPTAFNCLAFENVWESCPRNDGALDTLSGGSGLIVPYVPPKIKMNEPILPDATLDQCGFVVPSYMANDKAINLNGVVDLHQSVALEMKNRIQIKSSDDAKDLDRKIAERPFNLTELLQRVSFNPLPREEALEQLKSLKNNNDAKAVTRHGTLTNVGGTFKFDPTADVRYIHKYPHKNDDNLTGCVTVYEMPYAVEGKTVGAIGEIYTAVLDPYYKDDAQDRTSLGALYVYKTPNKHTGNVESLVASYVARPDKLTDFYKNAFNVVQWYKAKLQSEILGGGKGVFDHARENRLLHYCSYEVTVDLNKDIAHKKSQNYFMNIPTERKKQGLLYLRDWLLSPIGFSDSGNTILMIHTIKDIPFLQEISKWTEKSNVDRISAHIVYMYQRKQVIEESSNRTPPSTSDFFTRDHFTAQRSSGNNSSGFLVN
jgi:hypothetical protein